MGYRATLNLPRTSLPMKANLSQREVGILSFWEEKKIYQRIREERKGRRKYILHDGPPYANGNIHMGQALNKILKDVAVKYKTAQGFDSPYVPGWDCHGLPVEHQLFKKLGINKNKISRLEFRQKAREYALHFVDKQRNQFKRLGVFGRWEEPYLTLSPSYEGEVIGAFGRLAKRGYIYRGLKPVRWCFQCQTALAEAEIEYKERQSPSIYVKFPVKDSSDLASSHLPVYLLIWTTTPWTLPANLAIAIHPQHQYCLVQVDKEILILAKDRLPFLEEEIGIKPNRILSVHKGEKLKGLKYNHPFISRQSEVLAADYVSLEEGTGCVHTAPGHGAEDYLLSLEHNLPVYSPVDGEGKFNSQAGELEGIKVFEANPLIVEKLKQKGYLLHQGKVVHSYPHCWRCGSALIYRATPQWFLAVDKHNLRQKAIRAVENEVEWIPPASRMRMGSMLKERPDWCLSRQRYWGVGIPVVYCKDCGEAMVDEEIIDRIKSLTSKYGSDFWFKEPVERILPPGYRCRGCGGERFKKEEDIIDVWFESGVSHHAVLVQEETLGDPSDLYLEGSDQHRGWFQTSLLTSMALKDRPPYRRVLTHGFVVDSEGRKMSKSQGNVVDPQEIVSTHGADVLRLWASLEDYTQDIRISAEILKYAVEVYRRIRNTYRFLLGNLYDFDYLQDALSFDELRDIDRWVLSHLQELVRDTTASFEKFKLHEAVHLVHLFATNELSSFYFDVLKDRLYTFPPDSKGRKSAQTTLWHLLISLSKLMAPILSFTAEEVWGHIRKIEGCASGKASRMEESVFLSSWPRVDDNLVNESLETIWEKILRVREGVLKELEEAREAKTIGSSLEARVTITAPFSELSSLKDLGNELKEVFIVSQVQLEEGEELKIRISRAEGQKCERCWNYSLDLGTDKEHPQLCGRCRKAILKCTR
ncbi:isoleucine--tRNA ligase [Candidatus Aerophobetes bacterium]|uniref:Isoleucine--tRNA ligase n=1 Tax=Aerophobetes bacterium TaxID=2030807 RepID=A0A523WA34_UNCAE|nr:MAG: isoleucine--tRNA ligase [Candidatus Aerophobetes bacterium]